jgi:hypothetical protein
MASKLAEAYVEINSRNAGLDGGLTSAQTGLKSFVGQANTILAGMGVGVSAAAIGKFFADAVSAASDLNESTNKVQVTFGSASASVIAFAEEMAAKFGLVKSTTLDAAANIGLIAQGAGYDTSGAANLSTTLVKLAADASSFFNVPIDVALEKIRSGLVGEAEPLREFGVLLSEDAVKAEAYRSGIAQVGQDLTDQQKVMARAVIIQRELGTASGDLERTQDGLANQLRKVSGDWENFKAVMGEDMVPAVSELIGLGYDLADAFSVAFGTGPLDIFRAAMVQITDGLTGLRLGLKGLLTGDMQGAAEDLIFGKIREGLVGFAGDLASGGVNERPKVPKAGKPTKPGKNIAGVPDNGGGYGMFGGFGMFGPMGAIDQMMLDQATLQGIDKQEEEIRRKQASWGGGHIMDSMAFLNAAQEKILQPEDETAKKSLEELQKIREAVTSKNPMTPGITLKGREH